MDIGLQAGGRPRSVEVTAGSSVLGTTATQEHGISPETLQQLPLAFNTGPRAAAAFAVLMPGVSTGGTANAFDARINGGMQSGDEATVDGVSMQQGYMSQGGMVSIFQDFPMSADMVSEVKVLTSNYAPEYGGTTGGQIQAVTKSGGSEFHGSAFDYHLNDALNADPWGKEKPTPQEQLRREHRRARQAAGPLVRQRQELLLLRLRRLPAGGRVEPADALDSVDCRSATATSATGVTPSGNLIPIYDPATLRPDGNGGFIKDQFMGCDGQHAQRDLSRSHQPDRAAVAGRAAHADERRTEEQLPGARRSPTRFWANADYFMWRYDLQLGTKTTCSRASGTSWRPSSSTRSCRSRLPARRHSDPQNSWVNRFNYDRDLHAHAAEPHVDGVPEPERGVWVRQRAFVDDFPQIAGVAANNMPPQIQFADDFAQMGCNAGIHVGNITTRPTFIINDAGDLDEGHAHAEGRDGVPQDHGKHPPERERGGIFISGVAPRV